MAQRSAGGVPALREGAVSARTEGQEESDTQRSRCSSRMTSSSREPSPWTQCSIQVSQVCSSSRNVHGRVQSSTITTAVWGRADCGGKKCDTRDVYEDAEEGTVYTDNRARISARRSGESECRRGPPSKGQTDLLLLRHVHRPSHILMRNLCVARPCCRRQLVFGGGQRRGCSCQLKAGREQGHSLLVSNERKKPN
jgi:hypothetical protein